MAEKYSCVQDKRSGSTCHKYTCVEDARKAVRTFHAAHRGDLFAKPELPKELREPAAGLIMRPLQTSDNDKGFLLLLSQVHSRAHDPPRHRALSATHLRVLSSLLDCPVNDDFHCCHVRAHAPLWQRGHAT